MAPSQQSAAAHIHTMVPDTRILLVQSTVWMGFGIFTTLFGVSTLLNDWSLTNLCSFVLALCALVIFQRFILEPALVARGNGVLYLPHSSQKRWLAIQRHGHQVLLAAIVILVAIRSARLMDAWIAGGILMLLGVITMIAGFILLLRAADNYDEDTVAANGSGWGARMAQFYGVEDYDRALEIEESAREQIVPQRR